MTAGIALEIEPGQMFGSLMTIGTPWPGPGGFRQIWCICVCGKEVRKKVSRLYAGVVSCGCLKNSTHRQTRDSEGLKTPTYAAWGHMKRRCTREEQYTSRGIRVCERWEKFENFLADMGPKPGPEYSLDRIDNDKGYSPGNCRWATIAEQNRNKRSNRWLTYLGQTLVLSDWCVRLKLKISTVRGRLEAGWSVEDALTLPLQKGKKYVKVH